MATEIQRHRAEREKGFPDNLFFSFPLCLCVSVSLWQNKCLNVACPDLAKHIADAAFGEIFRELEYKAKWYGRTYLPLDRYFPSSKLCSSCGYLLEELPLSVREWDCPACDAHHDPDINAAINIKKAGQYLLKLLKATGSDARKVTPTRNERRRSA